MRRWRYYPRHGYIFLLLFFFCTVTYLTSDAATSPRILKVVRVDYWAGRWHVVLTGTESMTYRATKGSDPLRVVVDLPNTLNKTVTEPLFVDKGAIQTIKTEQLVHYPQPRTRVEIGLNRDVSYKISRRGGEIWISFNTVPPKSKAAPSLIEPAPELKRKVPQSAIKPTPEAAILQHSAGEPKPVEEKHLNLATRILAIEPVTLDDGLHIHIIGDGRLENYHAFVLKKPHRLVVDFFGVRSSEVKADLILEGSWAERVRVGQHTDKVRIVFDLVFTPKGEHPFQVILEEQSLVVSFSPNSGLSSP